MADTDRWYEAKTGNDQGLIISETTGENIAVAYDKKNAALIAAAPKLLDIAKRMRNSVRHSVTCQAPWAFPCSCDADRLWQESAQIIAQAEGRDNG